MKKKSQDLLGGINNLAIKGAESHWNADGVLLRLKPKAMSPLIKIGDAV